MITSQPSQSFTNPRSTMRLIFALMVFGFGLSLHAAPSSRAKVKIPASRNAATEFQAGLTIPGLTSSIQTRVTTIRGKLPLYVGADLDMIFSAWYYSAAVIMPMASATLHIPTRSIVTPTAGVAVGPAFILGNSYGSAVSFSFLVKPGVLVNIDKGMDLFADLRLGLAYGGFGFLPSAGMRFAL